MVLGGYPNSLAAIGDTPLIDFPTLEPDTGASIALKWEGANPTGSIKDRMALAMVEAARKRDDLQPDDPVVEFTGGSTGSSLAFVCAVLGHPFHVVTADCVATEKIDSMRALGAQVEIVETPNGRTYDGLFEDLRTEARRVREEVGGYFTDQFENRDQLDGYRALGAEILDDKPDVDEFVMSVGTGGCAMGTSRAFREADADVTVSLVEPAESPVLTDGTTGEHSVQGTAIVESPPLIDDALYDEVYTITNDRCIECVRDIAQKEGMLVGTSTGMNVAAARQIAATRDSDYTIVTVACDTGLKYLSDGLYDGLEGSSFCL